MSPVEATLHYHGPLEVVPLEFRQVREGVGRKIAKALSFIVGVQLPQKIMKITHVPESYNKKRRIIIWEKGTNVFVSGYFGGRENRINLPPSCVLGVPSLNIIPLETTIDFEKMADQGVKMVEQGKYDLIIENKKEPERSLVKKLPAR